MFDIRCESEADLEDSVDWARIERELRQDNDDRTHGNTLPSGLFALEIDDRTPVPQPSLRLPARRTRRRAATRQGPEAT
jgi:hypothetical protein